MLAIARKLAERGWYLRVAPARVEVDFPSDLSVSVGMLSYRGCFPHPFCEGMSATCRDTRVSKVARSQGISQLLIKSGRFTVQMCTEGQDMLPSPWEALTTTPRCHLQVGKVNPAPHSFVGGP